MASAPNRRLPAPAVEGEEEEEGMRELGLMKRRKEATVLVDQLTVEE